jgi:hypothetical protein
VSKISLGVLLTAIALIILAVFLEVPYFTGGSGVLFVAALVYSYHVAKRDMELLQYAMEHADDEDDHDEEEPYLLTQVAPVQGFGKRYRTS